MANLKRFTKSQNLNLKVFLKVSPNVLQVGDSNFTDFKNETKWKIK